MQAVEAAYKGGGEPGATSAAKAAYFQAWARDLRPVAGQASDATLKTTLIRAADILDEAAGGRPLTAAELNGTWQPLLDTCAATSSGAPPTS